MGFRVKGSKASDPPSCKIAVYSEPNTPPNSNKS